MVPDRVFSNQPNLARQRGPTIFELTVVITLFLVLVGVLFIGFTAWKIEANQSAPGLPASIATNVFTSAWKDGANKGVCLVNLSAIQKAMRG